MIATLYARTSTSVVVSLDVQVITIDKDPKGIPMVTVRRLDNDLEYHVRAIDLTKENGDPFDIDEAVGALDAA